MTSDVAIADLVEVLEDQATAWQHDGRGGDRLTHEFRLCQSFGLRLAWKHASTIIDSPSTR